MFEIDPTKFRILDISYEVVPPGSDDRPFVIEKGYLADMAYKYDVTKTHSHVGTHVEAPAHFFDNGKDSTELPLSVYYGRAVLLEIDDAAKDKAIMPDLLDRDIGDLIKEGDIIILRNNDEESLKGNRPKPYLAPEAGKWMNDHGVKMIGIDNNVGLGKDIPATRELHDVLMGVGVPIIEWLDSLDQLKKKEFFLMALPFKVKQMDSSWTRVIAIEEI